MALSLDVKRQNNGEFEDVIVQTEAGEELVIRIKSVSADRIRTEVTGSRSIKIFRKQR